MHEVDQDELSFAVDILRESTLAHEVYHLRQKYVLYHTSIMNTYRHSPTNIRRDVNSLLHKKKETYKYDPIERAADAFAIRYLRERRTSNDKEELVNQKIIDDETETQELKSADMSMIRSLDKALRK